MTRRDESLRTRVGARWIPGAIAGACLLLVLLPLVSPLITPPKYDEFIVAYDAQRVLDGQVPYRDYFSFLPPGTHYLLAAMYAPFGRGSLTVARYASLAVVFAGWLFLYGALRRSAWGRGEALWLSLAYPICWYPFWPVASHHWIALLWCMALLWVIADPRGLGRPRGGYAAGVLVGLALVTLQTEGLYLALGTVAFMALSAEDGLGRPRIGDWLKLAAGAAGVVLPVYGVLIASGAGPNMVHDLILWPARNYNQPGNDNARPLLQDLPVRFARVWSETLDMSAPVRIMSALAGTIMHVLLIAAALAVLGATAWTLARFVRERTIRDARKGTACLVAVAACALYLKGRPDWLHGMYPLAIGGSFWLVALGPTAGRRAKGVLGALAGILVVAGAFYAVRRPLVHPPSLAQLADVDRPVREYVVNKFLHDPQNLAPGESVAALPEGGEVYLYGPKPAIGFTLLFPLDAGLNDLEDHARAAADMERNRPRWVVLRPDVEKGFLTPGSPLGRIIARDYSRKGVLGAAVMYERKS